jgi:serine/threonine protein kinase
MHKFDDMTKDYKKTKSLQSKLFIKTYNLVFNNFKVYFKHLVIGMYKLHKARIVNCDIKKENILVNYDTKTNKVTMRFIDFGYSEHLTDEYCKKYSNIKTFGTTKYLSPEIFIADILNRYIKSGSIKTITAKIVDRIDTYIKAMYDDLKEYEYKKMLFKYYESADTKAAHIKHIPVIEEVYNDILHHFENKTILDAYFGTHTKTKTNILDGYLQKADIYALGCCIYDFLSIDSTMINVKKNMKLHHLLKKMIHPDPKKRYNILECLKHPYFK